jgi:hypothetical protein
MHGEKVTMIDDIKLSANLEFTKASWCLPSIIERHGGRRYSIDEWQKNSLDTNPRGSGKMVFHYSS